MCDCVRAFINVCVCVFVICMRKNSSLLKELFILKLGDKSLVWCNRDALRLVKFPVSSRHEDN